MLTGEAIARVTICINYAFEFVSLHHISQFALLLDYAALAFVGCHPSSNCVQRGLRYHEVMRYASGTGSSCTPVTSLRHPQAVTLKGAAIQTKSAGADYYKINGFKACVVTLKPSPSRVPLHKPSPPARTIKSTA